VVTARFAFSLFAFRFWPFGQAEVAALLKAKS
jgi:hypothetical protein